MQTRRPVAVTTPPPAEFLFNGFMLEIRATHQTVIAVWTRHVWRVTRPVADTLGEVPAAGAAGQRNDGCHRQLGLIKVWVLVEAQLRQRARHGLRLCGVLRTNPLLVGDSAWSRKGHEPAQLSFAGLGVVLRLIVHSKIMHEQAT